MAVRIEENPGRFVPKRVHLTFQMPAVTLYQIIKLALRIFLAAKQVDVFTVSVKLVRETFNTLQTVLFFLNNVSSFNFQLLIRDDVATFVNYSNQFYIKNGKAKLDSWNDSARWARKFFTFIASIFKRLVPASPVTKIINTEDIELLENKLGTSEQQNFLSRDERCQLLASEATLHR